MESGTMRTSEEIVAEIIRRVEERAASLGETNDARYAHQIAELGDLGAWIHDYKLIQFQQEASDEKRE